VEEGDELQAACFLAKVIEASDIFFCVVVKQNVELA